MKRILPKLGPAALAGMLVIASPSLATAQSPPLWGKLSPGSYAVGFRIVLGD
jgi:hypothetical protein